MSLKIVPLVRKSFPAEGVLVSKENFVEVAEWCKGVLHSEPDESGSPVAFIKVDVTRPINEKQTKALVGDWVVKVGHGFKVFNVHSFQRSFEEVPINEPDEVLEGLVIHQTNFMDGSVGLKRQVEESFDSAHETRPTVRGW